MRKSLIHRIAGKAILLLIALLIASCADGDRTPVLPSDDVENPPGTAAFILPENRTLMGFYRILIPADRSGVEVVAERSAMMHLNAVRLLEVTPCTDCLMVSNVFVTTADVMHASITLRHPFPGLLKYSAFDVRGIVMTGSNYTFPESCKKIAWEDGVRLLHPDGYTSLFNPTEFPTDLPGPPALRYIPGKFEFAGDLSATLNPYMGFKKDEERRLFEAGEMDSTLFSIQLVPGNIELGYAVDACWTPVDGEVTDPLTDFPPEANCREAYQFLPRQGKGLRPVAGTSALLQLEVMDHQGPDTISTVILEAPDLFDGTVEMPLSAYTDEGAVFQAEIFNEKGVDEGEYPLLARVLDWDDDENFGQVDAWQVVGIKVNERGYPLGKLIEIPEGWFYMGVDPANDPDGVDEFNTPGHNHPTGGYWISRCEITKEEFDTFVSAGGYSDPRWWSPEGWAWKESEGYQMPHNWSSYLRGRYPPSSPMSATYYEAEAFCNFYGGRLPTEPEWERAARGDTDHRIYPWGDEFDPLIVAWEGNPLVPYAEMMPVGSFSPASDSPWGLADCSGNQSEWTSDWGTNYKEIYDQYASGDFTPPPPPEPGEYRRKIERGGNRSSDPEMFRCARRQRCGIDMGWAVGRGFRIVFDG